jgi:hypothetical protein
MSFRQSIVIPSLFCREFEAAFQLVLRCFPFGGDKTFLSKLDIRLGAGLRCAKQNLRHRSGHC